jgi:hypothetical protein
MPDANRPKTYLRDNAEGLVLQSGASLTLESGATASLESVVLSGNRAKVNLAAATQDLTANQSGEHFVAAVDAVFTLPASAPALKGVEYEFSCGALSAGTGLSISPAAADAIGGNGLTVVVNKDLINSGASDRLGDYVKIVCTGETGATAWRITGIIGTWAKEA